MVMTLRIELDIQPVRREKKGKIEVHQALDDFDEYDDFDDGMPAYEIDEDDGMGLGNVGS
jgi:hypothetical protein